MTRLEKAVRKIIYDCLKLDENETSLIVVDQENFELGRLLLKTAHRINKNVLMVEANSIKEHNGSSKTLESIISHVQSNIIVTSDHFNQIQMIKNACHHGSRIIYLSRLSTDIIERCINTDFDFIIEKSQRLADLLSIGKVAKLTSPGGTDITIPIGWYKAFSNTGMVHEAGTFAALPSGEACIPPVKDKAEGIIVVDGSLGALGLVNNPITLRIKEGYVKKITGDDEAAYLRKILKPFGKEGRNLAELGIGTNPRAIITGKSIEDEKVLGTVHVAFGDSEFEGGSYQTNCHIDAIIRNPTLEIDGHLIIDEGKLKV